MRASPLSVIAVVALLVLAGCAGAPNASENQTSPDTPPDVSPDEFPSASEITPSVFATHATEMGNTSFTLATQRNRTDRNPVLDANFSYYNSSRTALFDTNDSQFLERMPGGELYSDGESQYMYSRVNNWTENQGPIHPTSPYNRSGENYLWSGILTANTPPETDTIAINATYERKDAEWFHGTAVMRYEATGVEALPEWGSGTYQNFSATLLLDENGVIRHYHYTFERPPADYLRRLRVERSYTITDIGTTSVEKPDWVAELQEDE